VISIQAPPGGGVSKRRLLLVVMTLFAFIGSMATRANSVNLLLALHQAGRFVDIMAVTAIFLLVTIHATQAEEIDMLLMVECNHGAGGVWRNVALLSRHGHHGMRDTHNIGRIFTRCLECFGVVGAVTDDTISIMTPFAVTAETLTVIGALQARLAEVVGIGLAAVTFAA